MWMSLSPAALAIAVGLYLGVPWKEGCRCQPHEPCWPSSADWDTLNHTLDGNLIALKPSGHACFPDDQTSETCQELVKNFHNTTWRVQNPGRFSLATTTSRLLMIQSYLASRQLGVQPPQRGSLPCQLRWQSRLLRPGPSASLLNLCPVCLASPGSRPICGYP